MSAPMTAQKREEMFKVFCDTGICNQVARTCKISAVTAKKYFVLDNWGPRLAKIAKKAADKNDNEEVKRQARHLKQAQLLQKVGASCFMDKKGNIVPVKKQRDAIQAIRTGIELERIIVGEPQKQDITLRRALEDMSEEELVGRLKMLQGK